LNTRPGNPDMDGKLAHELSMSATNPCEQFNGLPKELICIY